MSLVIIVMVESTDGASQPFSRGDQIGIETLYEIETL